MILHCIAFTKLFVVVPTCEEHPQGLLSMRLTLLQQPLSKILHSTRLSICLVCMDCHRLGIIFRLSVCWSGLSVEYTNSDRSMKAHIRFAISCRIFIGKRRRRCSAGRLFESDVECCQLPAHTFATRVSFQSEVPLQRHAKTCCHSD